MRLECRIALPVAIAAWLGGAAGAATSEARPTWNPREAVELRLAASRALAGADIHVEPGDRSRVRLTGAVRDEAQRERAVWIASRTPGVAAVEDGLVTGGAERPAPDARPDPEIARDVAQRLVSRSPAAATADETWTSGWRVRGDGWSLAVDVDDGDVLLEGEVLLQEHLRQFVLAARGVPGVRSVRADATLRANPPPDDPYHP